MLQIRDIWQRVVTNGDPSGTNAPRQLTFLYTLALVAAFCAGGNTLNVLTALHAPDGSNVLGPVIGEASSWTTLVFFFWIPWAGVRAFPVSIRPRWLLLFHIPFSVAYSLCHVGGFVLIRKAVYRLLGGHYDYGPFWANYLYEYRKDVVAYSLFVVGVAFITQATRLRHPAPPPKPSATFDIRDGARLYRVALDDVLAVSSAGNYAEFILQDGRKLLMRSSLSALEADLKAYGFLRTHRSWLVNPARMTALHPQGSGDYAIDLGALSVPLSRRFPAALSALRNGTPNADQVSRLHTVL